MTGRPTTFDNYSQTQPLIVSLISVTSAVYANNLPVAVIPAVSEILSRAKMFPRKVVSPRVAELPTCQKTLQGLPTPFLKTILPPVVVSVVAIWKIQTASGLLWASRVRTPDDIVKVPLVELL